MTYPDRISKLANQFDRNREAFLSGHYKEAQLRNEFIDPFFIALGWDVHNEQGYAPQYQDVIHEAEVKVGGLTKAPDYSFRIGGNRKFFLEVKKPSINIKEDISSAFQLRRYAWSAKLPLSILSDFEEFAVYNCRLRPNKFDKASKGRLIYITYKEYPDRWDEIESVFSKEAVMMGEFDRFAERPDIKKGTTEVDSEFLKEIESWRDILARNIAIRNPNLSQRDLNFTVQRTIDRIIFLRVCEDRGIEREGRLLTLLNGENVYKRLFGLFRDADDRYNSGLFHFEKESGRTSDPDLLTPGLNIDDNAIKDIIKDLYYPESPYEFSVISADILGQVYEQFLGKVIRLTASHHAKVEEKPEVKKAGGVYYTPTYIVDYIVENTVGKLIEGKTPNQVSKLKILDPACGSGSFLIGAYQKLLDWHRDFYVNEGPEKHTKRLYQGPGGEWRLATDEKKRILLNNIYGVDIDNQAVEVTKLSLLLKVLEGESEETINTQLKMFHKRALPDLGGNIKCGNSLIGPDFYEGVQMSFLGEEEKYRINVFDWNKEFSEIMGSGGFDAVIGNPPYVVIKGGRFLQGYEYSKKEIDTIKTTYKTAQQQINLYTIFIEQSAKIINSNGVCSYIIPNTILANEYSQKIRTFLLNEVHTQILNNVGMVFEGSVVEALVLLYTKKKHNSGMTKIIFNGIESNIDLKKIASITTDNKFLLSLNEKKLKVITKLNKNPRLSMYAKVWRGLTTGNDKKYLSNTSKTVKHKKLITGKEIERYINKKSKLYVYYDKSLLDRPREERIFLLKEKLVSKFVGKKLTFAYDNEQHYVLNTGCITEVINSSIHIKYLLALLNSTLLNFYFKTIYTDYRDAFPIMKSGNLENLPISKATTEQMKKIEDLANQMLDLHKKLNETKSPHDKTAIQRQIDATDEQIDNLVYKLYGLSEEEIKIVEESTR